jgi:hypothetical protein
MRTGPLRSSSAWSDSVRYGQVSPIPPPAPPPSTASSIRSPSGASVTVTGRRVARRPSLSHPAKLADPFR